MIKYTARFGSDDDSWNIDMKLEGMTTLTKESVVSSQCNDETR
jgi:predicted RNA-binding protein with PUA domain